MRTVGVEYDGLVLVVGFTVDDNPSSSCIVNITDGVGSPIYIHIEEISEFRKGRIEALDSDYAEAIATDWNFTIATLYAIAAFDGQDFDPQTFRRMN